MRREAYAPTTARTTDRQTMDGAFDPQAVRLYALARERYGRPEEGSGSSIATYGR